MSDELKRYRVVISGRAARMLVSHAGFLAGISKSAAEKLVEEFEAAAESLSTLPYRCPWLRGDFIPANKYRFLLFRKRYMMIYQIQDDTVFVDYVVDCRQDYQWLIN